MIKNIENMKRVILLLFFLPFMMFGQEWINKMQDPSNNFYDIQAEFNQYWEDKTVEKGK